MPEKEEESSEEVMSELRRTVALKAAVDFAKEQTTTSEAVDIARTFEEYLKFG